jgi:hypothetical protein
MDKSKIITILMLFVASSSFAQNSRAFFSMPIEQTFYRRYSHPLEDSLVISSVMKDDRISNDDKFELFLASKYPKETATHIQLIHKLTSVNLGEEFITVKYREFKDTLSLAYICKVFKNQATGFTEVPNDAVGYMFEAIKILKTETFRAFLNSDPTKLKEIDAIKTRFKDSEGILDIDKLGAFLATKPKELEKYCDY